MILSRNSYNLNRNHLESDHDRVFTSFQSRPVSFCDVDSNITPIQALG